MRSDTQQASRRRRGGRRPRSPRDSFANESAPKAPVKPGFFQRILAFFKGKPKGPDRAYGQVFDKPSVRPAAASSSVPTGGNGNGHPSTRKKIEFDSQPAKVVRKPELVEVTSAKLYVGNLSFDAVESDLSELFAGVGSVQNAEVVSHRETQKSKGFAFITMGSLEEARRAVTELHDKEFMGRRLVVSGAKTSDVQRTR